MRSFSLSVTLKLNTGTTSVYNVLHRLSILLYESSQGTAEREEPAAGLARRAEGQSSRALTYAGDSADARARASDSMSAVFSAPSRVSLRPSGTGRDLAGERQRPCKPCKP